MVKRKNDTNIDSAVVSSFGYEWSKFSYLDQDDESFLNRQFEKYSSIIDLKIFDAKKSVAADIGAGSGRWTMRLESYFRKIIAVEPSAEAVEVLKKRFSNSKKFTILNESAMENSIDDESIDLLMALGVLHHLPNTELAIRSLQRKLTKGGVFWCYLYYNLENKPLYYKLIFNFATILRLLVSRLPNTVKLIFSFFIACFFYWPLSRISKFFSLLNLNYQNIPLHHYREMPFKVLLNDSFDRFGTKIEKRFGKQEIIDMLIRCGFDSNSIKFSDTEPFYTFIAKK